MFVQYIAWIIFFEVVFLKIIFTNSRKSAIGFTPGVFQGVYSGVFISFGHSFGIIIKQKCSPFNQGIIQQSIMSVHKDITPMTELSDPPSYDCTGLCHRLVSHIVAHIREYGVHVDFQIMFCLKDSLADV